MSTYFKKPKLVENHIDMDKKEVKPSEKMTDGYNSVKPNNGRGMGKLRKKSSKY